MGTLGGPQISNSGDKSADRWFEKDKKYLLHNWYEYSGSSIKCSLLLNRISFDGMTRFSSDKLFLQVQDVKGVMDSTEFLRQFKFV
ncbi:hypothetical protein Tco_0737777 [Tanacetum coccineum]|uniref:Uncharacterized protein n=1 Tax=Tanacetum coccineum TaxID=301880 RepID=A0ABQ5DGZ9_9ASTR